MRRVREPFLTDARAGLTMYAAIAIPVLLVSAGGAIDIAAAQAQHAQLLSIAQGAALAGARDLSLAAGTSMATGRADAWAHTELAHWQDAPASNVSSTVVDIPSGGRGVRVAIAASRESLFGRLLPPGGWHINVEAIASPVGNTPLCVIATQPSDGDVLHLRNESAVQGPNCMIHSNSDIDVDDQAHIEAGFVEAVGAVNGDVSPSGVSDAPAIDDPFTGVDLTQPGGGNRGSIIYTTGVHSLAPGIHREQITLRGDAVLHLEPGDHWFVNSNLVALDNSRVEGEDVVLVFDDHSRFQFLDLSLISLDGRKSGSFSGFVLIAAHGNTNDFVITSEHVDSLLGVVYAPDARLVIYGRASVARQSAWTVIVAKAILLRGNPTLFLNANYRDSDVPVPGGVGPRSGTRLVQ